MFLVDVYTRKAALQNLVKAPFGIAGQLPF
jgi:hypothetical protein